MAAIRPNSNGTRHLTRRFRTLRQAIQRSIRQGRYTHSLNAERMRQEARVTMDELEAALGDCTVLKEHDETCGASCLVMGFAGSRPIHALCALRERPHPLVVLAVM